MPFAPALRLSGCAALALLLAACAPDKDPLDTLTGATAATAATAASNSGGSNSGTASNSGGTDGGTGGGTGSASNSGATDSATSGATEATGSGPTSDPTGDIPGEPAQVCLDLLACIGVASPDALPQAEMVFGPEGACWTDPQMAAACAEQCATSLQDLGVQFPDVPECGGGGGNTTDPGTTTNDTGPVGEWGNCGWDAMNSYYACLGMPGQPDPNGGNPIDCPPNLPEAGAACDQNSDISDIGCCTPTGDNYYCGQSGIVIEPCGGA